MTDPEEFPWRRLAVVAGSVMTAAVVARGLSAVGALAIDEARYRASDPDTVLRWLR